MLISHARSLVLILLGACLSLSWAANAPVLDVKRGGTAVTNGGTDTITGTVAGAPQDLNFVVSNLGSSSLSLGRPVISSATNCVATVTGVPSTAVAPSSSTPLQIRVVPIAAGSWSFVWTMDNNDSTRNPFSSTVRGTAASSTAKITLIRNLVTIPNNSTDSITGSQSGLATSLTYTISNTGAGSLGVAPVYLAAATNCNVSILTQPTTTIDAGKTSDFVISLTPGQAQWSTRIQILNSDSAANPFTITISGNASGPQMAIQRGATDLPNNSSIVVPEKTYAGLPDSISLTYRNLGNGNLNIYRYAHEMQAGGIRMGSPFYEVGMSGSVDLTVQRTDGYRGPASVRWQTQDGTALSGVDYTSASGILTWADGDNTDRIITVQTLLVTNPAGVKIFTVSLSDVSGSVLGIPVSSTIQINPPAPQPVTTWANGRIIFASKKILITEGDPPAVTTIPVEINRVGATLGVLAGPIQVHWELISGSAQPGPQDPDYVLASGNISMTGGTINPLTGVITPAQTSAIIPVQIIGDILFESTESFLVRLSQPVNCVLGPLDEIPQTTQTAIIYILDDDPPTPQPITTFTTNCTVTAVSLPNRTIPPTGSVTGTIQVVPTTAGQWSFGYTIGSDDPVRDPYQVTISGNAAPQKGTIKVDRGGVVIVSGGSDNVTGLAATKTSRVTYTVSNQGTINLTFDNSAHSLTAVTNCTATFFPVLPTLTSPLRPTFTTTMPIDITPANPGPWSVLVSVNNSDPDASPFNFTLSGIAQPAPAPDIQFSRGGTIIANGATDTVPGGMASIAQSFSYVVSNIGNDSLVLTGTTAPVVTNCTATVTSPPLGGSQILAGSSASLVIRITPVAAGPWTAVFSQTTNDPDEANATFTLAGTAVAAAPTAAVFRDGASVPLTRVDRVAAVWLASTNYLAGALVNNGGKIYACTTAGTSAAAGGPTGTGNAITDGTVVWAYQATPVLIAGNDAITGTVAGQTKNVQYAISNQGFGTLTLAAATVDPNSAIGNLSNCTVAVTTPPASPVSAGNNTTAFLAITPTALGTWSFTYTLQTNDPNLDSDLGVAGIDSKLTFTITGIAAQSPPIGPSLTVNRGASFFSNGGADQAQGSIAGNRMVVTYNLTNIGTTDLTFTRPATISGVTNCYAAFIALPAESLRSTEATTLTFEVTPLSTGPWAFTWTLITNEGPNSPRTLTVSGTAAPPAGPAILVMRGTKAISSATAPIVDDLTVTSPVDIGGSLAIAYRVSNVGTQDLTVPQPVAVSSTVNCAADIVTPLPSLMQPNTSQDLRLNVTPTAVGAWSFVVTINSNDPVKNPLVFTVSGVAQTPTPKPFLELRYQGSAVPNGGDVVLTNTLANRSESRTISLYNIGNATLTLTGTPTVQFVEASKCIASLQPPISTVTTLAAGAHIDVPLSITPTARGDFSVKVSVPSNDPGKPVTTMKFRGTAQGPQISIVRPGVQITNGSTDSVTSTSAGLDTTINYTISNVQQGTLNIGAITLTGGKNCSVAVVAAPASALGAGVSTTLGIRVTPDLVGVWDATLKVTSDDTITPVIQWTMTGSATFDPKSVINPPTGGSSGGCGLGGGLAVLAGLALALRRQRRR